MLGEAPLRREVLVEMRQHREDSQQLADREEQEAALALQEVEMCSVRNLDLLKQRQEAQGHMEHGQSEGLR